MGVKKIIHHKLSRRKGWFLKCRCRSVKDVYKKYYSFVEKKGDANIEIRRLGKLGSKFPYAIYLREKL